jgi:hypothetical protein
MEQRLFQALLDIIWTQPSKLKLSSFSSSRVGGKESGSSTCHSKYITCWMLSIGDKELWIFRGKLSRNSFNTTLTSSGSSIRESPKAFFTTKANTSDSLIIVFL